MRRVTPSVASIQASAANAAFGRRLITNIHRGLIAEAIVASALGADWRWCSEDYSSWDFEREDGLRLEVKQSAARQSWAGDADKPSSCSFDIAARKGRYEGVRWIDSPGRHAQVYVFAHHPRCDAAADHRDPDQWQFYVVRADDLPPTKRMGMAGVCKLARACGFAELASIVAKTAVSVAIPQQAP